MEQQVFSAMGLLARLKGVAAGLARRGARVVVVATTDGDPGLGEALSYFAVSPGKALVEPGDALRPLIEDGGFGDLGRMLAGEIPAVFLSAAAARRVLDGLGVDPSELASYRTSRSVADLPEGAGEGSLRLRVHHDRAADGLNVAAVLRGRDPALRREAVVFSAHMDHVGRRLDGDVFNGADDNASGCAGLLEIAEAFAAAGPPARSVVFLAVSGEELGLWGSAWFAAQPGFEGEMVANVNIDMIGRSGPDSGPREVAVTPSHRHPAFSTLVRAAAGRAEALGLGLRNGDRWYERSDHFNFARAGIPVVFFCDGEHEDYHQVSDHADKLDAGKMERVARLAFWTGLDVAEAPERPQRLGRRPGWQR